MREKFPSIEKECHREMTDEKFLEESSKKSIQLEKTAELPVKINKINSNRKSPRKKNDS